MLERAWLTGLASLTSAYLRRVARTLKLHLVSFGPDGRPAQLTLADAVRQTQSRGGVLLPFWNAHSLLLIASYVSSEELRSFANAFEAVADDSIGGRLTHLIYPRIGIVGRQLSIRSEENRLADLAGILATLPNLAMAADSHGPYRNVSTGMARLARRYSRNVLPISAICSRAVRIFPEIGMAVPLPGATIHLGFTRLDLPAEPSVAAICMALRETLASLERNLAANG